MQAQRIRLKIQAVFLSREVHIWFFPSCPSMFTSKDGMRKVVSSLSGSELDKSDTQKVCETQQWSTEI